MIKPQIQFNPLINKRLQWPYFEDRRLAMPLWHIFTIIVRLMFQYVDHTYYFVISNTIYLTADPLVLALYNFYLPVIKYKYIDPNLVFISSILSTMLQNSLYFYLLLWLPHVVHRFSSCFPNSFFRFLEKNVSP